MPKKGKQESESEQTARFLAEVDRLIAAGELNPTEAEDKLNQLTEGAAHKQIRRPAGGEKCD